MRKLIFQLQMYAVAVFFSAFPAFSLKAGNFEIHHSGFNQLALMHGHVINYRGFSSSQIEHVPSVLKAKPIKPATLVSGWQDETDADAAWRKYYRKYHGKGIGCTTSGAILLGAGVGAVIAGAIMFNHANQVQNQVADYTYFGGGSIESNNLDTLNSQLIIGEALLGFGSGLVCAGIPLLCSGSHFLSKARGIKRDAEHHDVIVYWAPAINPAIRNYACAFSLKF
jgi:hypothetical protein